MTPLLVLSTTACAYGLDVSALRGRSRSRKVTEARAVAAFLAYELTGVSYRGIGAELGGRERSWACRMVDRVSERLCLRERGITARVARVERELQTERAAATG